MIYNQMTIPHEFFSIKVRYCLFQRMNYAGINSYMCHPVRPVVLIFHTQIDSILLYTYTYTDGSALALLQLAIEFMHAAACPSRFAIMSR